MSVYIEDELLLNPYEQPLTHARFLFREPATYTASGYTVGHEAEYLGDFSTAKYWTSLLGYQNLTIVNDDPSVPIDSLGIVGSGLGNTVSLYKTVGTTETLVMTATGTENTRIMLFRPTVADSWRVRTTGPVSVLWLSNSLKMPRPNYGAAVPAYMARQAAYTNYVSESGEYLDRFVKKRGLTFSASWANIPEDTYLSDLDAAMLRMESEPFFYAGRPYGYADDCAYAWATSIEPSRAGTRNFVNLSIKMGGYFGNSD